MRRHQRGVAVITALLLTTLAITLVASLFWQQQVQVRSIENQRQQLQKQWVLRGAVDWARFLLIHDGQNAYSEWDSLDEPWATPLAETRLDAYVENSNPEDNTEATLSGRITDAQSLFNLNNMIQGGAIVPDEVAAFARLLSFLKLDPALAQTTANTMLATFQKPAASSDSPTQPMRLSQVDDLLAVPGFSPEMLGILRNFVIVLPGNTNTTSNVNTAPAEVLAARIGKLSLSRAAAIVDYRTRIASFKSMAAFTSEYPETANGPLSTTTTYFLVNGKIRLERAALELQALVWRSRGNPPETKVIWIREN
jgi:general secretion pathway protein K